MPPLKEAATPLIDPFVPVKRTSIASAQIGGGGGQQQLTRASEGHLPKVGPQFVPPMVEIVNQHPKLAMEMTIDAPPDISLIDRNLPNIGDPLSKLSGFSGGTGGPLGIGNGKGTGIGDKRGPGAGDGDSIVGSVYGPGKGITLPVVIHKVEPEFSEEARKAHYSGSVLIRVDVDAMGNPRNIRIIRSVGMGLDDRAVEAVSKWRFKPGTKDGKPVAVQATIDVSFRLL